MQSRRGSSNFSQPSLRIGMTLCRGGLSELVEGLSNWRIWHLLGSGDLRRRYARSWGGQFWQTLSTGITAAIMGVVWSVLWRVPIAQMLPYLVTSLILWQFISGMIGDSVGVFPNGANILLGQRIATSTVVYSMIYRNFLIFLHNAVVIVVVFALFWQPVSLQIVLIVPALLLVLVTSVWFSFVCGALCARFRDLGNVVQSVLQLAFYVTPVIWRPEFLAEKHRWLLYANPFAVFMQIARGTVFNEPVSAINWSIASGIAFGGLLLALPIIGAYRRRLTFWL